MEKIFNKVLEDLKKDKKNKSIIVVGSNSKLDFSNIKSDIDLFVINEDVKTQVREIKNIYGFDFDINYFNEDLCLKFLDNKEYFFVEGLYNGSLIYDIDMIGQDIISKAKSIFEIGPCYMNEEELNIFKISILDNISSLSSMTEKCERLFFSNTLLKDILRLYFYKHNIWMPKDKKVISYMKNNEKNILSKIEKFYESYDLNILIDLINYIIR